MISAFRHCHQSGRGEIKTDLVIAVPVFTLELILISNMARARRACADEKNRISIDRRERTGNSDDLSKQKSTLLAIFFPSVDSQSSYFTSLIADIFFDALAR